MWLYNRNIFHHKREIIRIHKSKVHSTLYIITILLFSLNCFLKILYVIILLCDVKYFIKVCILRIKDINEQLDSFLNFIILLAIKVCTFYRVYIELCQIFVDIKEHVILTGKDVHTNSRIVGIRWILKIYVGTCLKDMGGREGHTCSFFL